MHFTEKVNEELTTTANLKINSSRVELKELSKKIDLIETEKQDLIIEIKYLWDKGFIRASITYRNEIYLELQRPVTAGNKHKTIYFGPDKNLDNKLNGKTGRVYVGKKSEKVSLYLEMVGRYHEISNLLSKLNSLQSNLGWVIQGIKGASEWL